eukprot:scaffold103000_cov31-Prasinocladus_malaysianus.AAC.1
MEAIDCDWPGKSVVRTAGGRAMLGVPVAGWAGRCPSTPTPGPWRASGRPPGETPAGQRQVAERNQSRMQGRCKRS